LTQKANPLWAFIFIVEVLVFGSQILQKPEDDAEAIASP